MATKLFVQTDAEYRGVQAGGEFVNNDGERIEYGPKLKFEVETPEGDVAMLPLPLKALDKAGADFDAAKLAKGAVVRLGLVVSVGADGYVGVSSATLAA